MVAWRQGIRKAHIHVTVAKLGNSALFAACRQSERIAEERPPPAAGNTRRTITVQKRSGDINKLVLGFDITLKRREPLKRLYKPPAL
jgi:hypothetical protein